MPFANVVHHDSFIALLAEDDSNDLLLVRRAIERLGLIHRLVSVSSGEEVLSYLERDPQFGDEQRYPVPNLLVLDQFMPRWSGLDVLLWIRSSPRFQHLPVVILSLGLSPAQVEEAHLLKAAWCAKTAKLEDLPAAIRLAVCSTEAQAHRAAAFSPPPQDCARLRAQLLALGACREEFSPIH